MSDKNDKKVTFKEAEDKQQEDEQKGAKTTASGKTPKSKSIDQGRNTERRKLIPMDSIKMNRSRYEEWKKKKEGEEL